MTMQEVSTLLFDVQYGQNVPDFNCPILLRHKG